MSIREQEERELIRKAQRGSAAAFEALVNEHAVYVYNLALRVLKDANEAEDMAQEAFLRAWQALPKFRFKASFKTWLYRIVSNLCYDRIPKMKQEMAALDPEEMAITEEIGRKPEKRLLAKELERRLHDAIDELPESYRLLITLRHVQEMSYQEIADATRQPLGTVKTGIYRARQRLGDIISDYGQDDVRRKN